MAVKKILLGQVWKSDDSGLNYLVTKIYSEVFTQYAVLRKVGAEDVMRLKIDKASDAQSLKGFTYTQESADF